MIVHDYTFRMGTVADPVRVELTIDDDGTLLTIYDADDNAVILTLEQFDALSEFVDHAT
jgi:hypothetical protein